MAAIAHSLFLFVFYTSRNWFSPSGLSAMLGGHAQVTLVLATNTNTVAKIFYFRQSSPGSANCILCSQTGHFMFSYPKTLLLWPGPAFSLSSSSCLQIIVSAVRNSIPASQCIAKNGKQQESKKKKPQGMYLLDGNSLFTIRSGRTTEFTFSLFIVWHWIYNILICYSRYVVLYAIVLEFYYTANAITSINQSCNHIKIYSELVWQDSSINNY